LSFLCVNWEMQFQILMPCFQFIILNYVHFTQSDTAYPFIPTHCNAFSLATLTSSNAKVEIVPLYQCDPLHGRTADARLGQHCETAVLR
jgi:hypothetical protein